MKPVSLNAVKEMLKGVTIPQMRYYDSKDFRIRVFYIFGSPRTLKMMDTVISSEKGESLDTFDKEVLVKVNELVGKDIIIITPKEIEKVFSDIQHTHGKITKSQLAPVLLDVINQKIEESNVTLTQLDNFTKITYQRAIEYYLKNKKKEVYVYAAWMKAPSKIVTLQDLINLGFGGLVELSTKATFYIKK